MEPQEGNALGQPEPRGKSRPGLSDEERAQALAIFRALVKNAVRQSLESAE
jgi:hypothetical protein